MNELGDARLIVLPEAMWQQIIEHCTRKLAGDFLADETPVRRAYGILAGSVDQEILQVKRVLPVKKNARSVEPYKTYMDTIMARHAVSSKTPLEKRGWITDPAELRDCYEQCDRDGLLVFGTYHMHIVAWPGDPVRDTPTKLDAVLAENSNLLSFIISMVDRENPMIRAFFEGRKDREIPVSDRAGKQQNQQ